MIAEGALGRIGLSRRTGRASWTGELERGGVEKRGVAKKDPPLTLAFTAAAAP